MSQANQLGCESWPSAAEGKCPVVKPSTHAQPSAVLVKPYQRKQYCVHRPSWPFQAGAKRRFGDAKTIGAQAGVRCVRAEYQLPGY